MVQNTVSQNYINKTNKQKSQPGAFLKAKINSIPLVLPFIFKMASRCETKRLDFIFFSFFFPIFSFSNILPLKNFIGMVRRQEAVIYKV